MGRTRFAKSKVYAEDFGLIDASGNLTELDFNAAVGLIGAMVGGYGEAAFDDGDTPQVILDKDDGGDRAVLIIVIITEDVKGTTKPVFQIGQVATLDKFIEIGEAKTFEDPDAGTVITAAGVLTDDTDMTLKVASAGATQNGGALKVFVMALPAEV